eukprot:scaffold2963_cov250-Pinguiococcus_pyrenoidosus.AAC.18
MVTKAKALLRALRRFLRDPNKAFGITRRVTLLTKSKTALEGQCFASKASSDNASADGRFLRLIPERHVTYGNVTGQLDWSKCP